MVGVGCFLLFMVPAACALFPQTVSVSTASLRTQDPEAFSQLQMKYGDTIPITVYYNKGL